MLVALVTVTAGVFAQMPAPERLRVEGLLSHEALLSEAKPRFSFNHGAGTIADATYGTLLCTENVPLFRCSVDFNYPRVQHVLPLRCSSLPYSSFSFFFFFFFSFFLLFPQALPKHRTASPSPSADQMARLPASRSGILAMLRLPHRMRSNTPALPFHLFLGAQLEKQYITRPRPVNLIPVWYTGSVINCNWRGNGRGDGRKASDLTCLC